jgi:hypothetical protein
MFVPRIVSIEADEKCTWSIKGFKVLQKIEVM